MPVSELENDWIHMLLYGRNRVGKTWLSCQFPKPLLLVAIEPTMTGGAQTVKKVPGVTYLRLTKSEEVETLGHELKENLQGFKSVVIDSGTSLDEITLAEIMKWDEPAVLLRYPKKGETPQVSRGEYAARSERMRIVLRAFLQLRAHVVINCNEKDHNPPEDKQKSAMVRSLQTESFFAAAMGGGTARWVQDGCDSICQLLIDKEYKIDTRNVAGQSVDVPVETGKLIRRLRTQYHPNYSAGFRSSNPKAVPEFIDEPTYDKIKAVIEGRELAS